MPLPWSGDEPPFGFGPEGRRSPGSRAPASWRGLTVEAESAARTRRSTLLPGGAGGAGTSCAPPAARCSGLDAPAGVLCYRRGDVTVVLNSGSEPFALPAGDVLLASGPLGDDGALPADTAAWLR